MHHNTKFWSALTVLMQICCRDALLCVRSPRGMFVGADLCVCPILWNGFFLMFFFYPALASDSRASASHTAQTYCLAELPEEQFFGVRWLATALGSGKQRGFTSLTSTDIKFVVYSNSMVNVEPVVIASVARQSHTLGGAVSYVNPVKTVAEKINEYNLRLSKFKITPRAGIYIPTGKNLAISYLGGFDLVWRVNKIVNMRLGVEYSNPGIEAGGDLKVFKVPLMFVENEYNPDLWGLKNLFYTGLGLVYINSEYNKVRTEGVGGAFLIGRKFGNRFSAEVKGDGLRKKTLQFGGVSTYINYIF